MTTERSNSRGSKAKKAFERVAGKRKRNVTSGSGRGFPVITNSGEMMGGVDGLRARAQWLQHGMQELRTIV